ncbi:hypothetical protein GQ53DRAFT_619596, partial [Thozetella sp. PMI_491]
QQVILSTNYIDHSHFIDQYYRDFMTIVHKLDSPTFFIMVTANPDWPEIKWELFPDETVLDRAGIVCHIFKEPRALIKEL